MLKSDPYYWVECDNCGERCEYGDFAAWSDFGMAIDGAINSDWTEKDGKHHCPSCPPLDVDEDKDAGGAS